MMLAIYYTIPNEGPPIGVCRASFRNAFRQFFELLGEGTQKLYSNRVGLERMLWRRE